MDGSVACVRLAVSAVRQQVAKCAADREALVGEEAVEGVRGRLQKELNCGAEIGTLERLCGLRLGKYTEEK
jgi:hypothetical protein